ncbi:MAG TPA: hypothetical protein VN840_21260 [Streptosporangiaceae bacterium]|nr:hypothetical protein [Streptosporangiaceae bacterium]
MVTLEDRVDALELQVEHLATWAGPGQAQALSHSLSQTRADLAKIKRTQDKHSRQLAQLLQGVGDLKAGFARQQAEITSLQADVAVLKADMAEVKGTLQEILRRLPPLSAEGSKPQA